MLTLLLATAYAYDLTPPSTIEAAAALHDLLVADVDGDGTPDLALATDEGLELDLSEAGAWSMAADVSGLCFGDLDGDGTSTLLACGALGLWEVLPTDGPTVTTLTDVPCSAAALVDFDSDGDADAATAGDTLLLWENDGGLSDPIDPGVAFSAAPLLAGDTQVAWSAEQGGSTLVASDLAGTSSLTLDGTVAGLAAIGSWPAWTQPDPDTLFLTGIDPVDLTLGAGPVAVSQVGGRAAVAVASASGVTVVDETGAVLATWEGDPGGDPVAVAFADLDGDGCPDVLAAADTTVTLLSGTGCDGAVDADGDGWTAGAGDCDDTDSDVHPEATEACNEVDDDCDGLTDEASVVADAPFSSNNEGGALRVLGSVSGCVADTRWTYAGDTDLARCDEQDDGLTVVCTLLDEGDLEVTLSALDDGGTELASDTASLSAWNAAPEIVSALSPVTVTVDGEEGHDVQLALEAQDLGVLDVLSWSLDGAPPGAHLDSEGTFTYTAAEEDLGTWTVLVTVTDDSGASDSRQFYLSVQQAAPDDKVGVGCCCFGATATAALPLWILFAPRRRRLL